MHLRCRIAGYILVKKGFHSHDISKRRRYTEKRKERISRHKHSIHERETNNELGSHLFAFAGTTKWSEKKVSNLYIIDNVDRSDAKSNDQFYNVAT